jgi:hypothetical protein
MKSLSAQEPLPENRHTKQQALQFLLSACITSPFSTLGFLEQLILQMEEIITTVSQKKKEIKKKGLMGLKKTKKMSKLCPHTLLFLKDNKC